MSSSSWIEPVTLETEAVRLEPLALAHAEALWQAGADPGIWTYMPTQPILTLPAMTDWIARSLELARDGTQVPFAIISRATGLAVGSTRYMDIRAADKGLEIGWTWVGRAHQRTAVNTHCKFRLLAHAFETLGAIRVQLKTDGRNLKSQAAIERIGAVREGVLRKQLLLPDGFVRDTVYFSVLSEEWPSVKERFLARMAAPRI